MNENKQSSGGRVVVFLIVAVVVIVLFFKYYPGVSSTDDVVCSGAIVWPEELKQSSPLSRMKSCCKKGFGTFDWGRTSRNCTAYLKAAAGLKCSEGTFSRRKRASRAQNRASVERWAEQFKNAILNQPNLDITSDGPDIDYLNTIGKRLADARTKPLFKNGFEFYLYDAKGDLSYMNENAFAIPGGAIFVGRSLYRQATEADLTFILGHEMAHIEWSSFSNEIMALVDQSLWSRLKGVMLSLCEGPMDEVVADRFAIRYMASVGYDVSAPTRLFWGPFRDGKDLSEYAVTDTHPPTTMRASFAYLEAKKHLSPARPLFRGSAILSGPWDGTFSAADTERCR